MCYAIYTFWTVNAHLFCCILLLPFLLIAWHILYAIIRHFHAQVVVSCVLSSCSKLLNKTSPPVRSVRDCLRCVFRNLWLGAGCEWTHAAWSQSLFLSPVPASCVTQETWNNIYFWQRHIIFFPSSFLYTWHYKHWTLWSYLSFFFFFFMSSNVPELRSNRQVAQLIWLRILFLNSNNWTGWSVCVCVCVCVCVFSDFYKMKLL